MSETAGAVRRHYAAAVQDYSDEYSPAYRGYPANQKRLEIVLARLAELRAKTLLDCGCGEGTPMRRIHEAGVQVWGFDFVPAMVAQARANLEGAGLRDRVWQGDVAQASSFRPDGIDVPASYDVCIAMGVFPHVENEVGALKNMAAVTAPGGRVLVEFRNELFSLFTLNRYSYRFFTDALMQLDRRKAAHPELRAALDRLSEELARPFALDLPPTRTGTSDAPGYDEIVSNFHNPFELDSLFEMADLRVVAKHFYHYHAVPPMFESSFPELFRTLSLEMERDPSDWRGHFMASAFVVEAVREA